MFNSDLSKWNTAKVTTMGVTFDGAKSFNFVTSVEASWELANPGVHPGLNMYTGTCSNDADCGRCGKKDTAGNPVTCSISPLAGTDVNTVCTLCANDSYEW